MINKENNFVFVFFFPQKLMINFQLIIWLFFFLHYTELKMHKRKLTVENRNPPHGHRAAFRTSILRALVFSRIIKFRQGRADVDKENSMKIDFLYKDIKKSNFFCSNKHISNIEIYCNFT